LFVYLARPIDQLGESSFLGSLEANVHALLVQAGVGAYLPHRAYLANVGQPAHNEAIDDLNTMAIHRADALVALLPAGIPTLGTPVEIEHAILLNKPTVVLTDVESSVQLAAWRRQGATILNLTDEFDMPTPSGLKAMLEKLPDPWAGSEPEHGTLFVKYGPGATKLERAHDTDAGLDLATSETVRLHYGSRVLIRTGVFGAVPVGWYGRITGRSSALSKWNIHVHQGIIDAGYTGELMIGATYRGSEGHVDIPAGTRLAQYILGPVWEGRIEETDELPSVSARGDNGWGSSGA
jgi:dUTP pyrophosphatase